MQLTVINQNGAASGSQVQVADVAFGSPFNETLVHQVVTAYLSGGRAGTRAQKTRSMVRGGGRKPWRQKGTGRARAGTIRSPLWRGGGKIFAAQPQDHSQKVNVKMYRAALRSIFSELARQNRLRVVTEMTLAAPKTKVLAQMLDGLGMQEALIITADEDLNLSLAARNLPHVAVRAASQIDPASLVAFQNVIVTIDAIKKIEERLQ